MEVLEKCQSYRFFDIFWDIVNNTLGQECVTEGFLSFQGKTGTIAPDFHEKMTVFL